MQIYKHLDPYVHIYIHRDIQVERHIDTWIHRLLDSLRFDSI